MNKYVIIIFFLLFAVFIQSGFPQIKKKSLSLNECVSFALQNHPDIQVLNEEENKVIADYRIKYATKLPQVGAGLSSVEVDRDALATSDVNIPGKDTKFGVVLGLSAYYDIYSPGRSQAVDITRINADMQKIKTKKNIELLIYNVKRSYYEYIKAHTNTLLRENVKDRYKNLLDKLRIEANAQEVRPITISNLEVSYQQSLLDYEIAVETESNARSALFYSIGLDEFDVAIDLIEINTIPNLVFSLDEMLSMANQYSPDLIIASMTMDAARTSVAAAKEQHYPNLKVAMTAGIQNNEVSDKYSSAVDKDKWQPTVNAGVTSQISIYNGGAINAAIDKANSEYLKSRHYRRKAELEIKMSITQNYKKLDFLKKQIDIAKASVKNAETNLIITLRGYANGMISQATITEATEALLMSKNRLLESKTAYLITVAELAMLVGVNEESLCQK